MSVYGKNSSNVLVPRDYNTINNYFYYNSDESELVSTSNYKKEKNFIVGWDDSDNGRKEYTLDQVNHDILKNTITFNSISDSIIGHEFNFVGARKNLSKNERSEFFKANDIVAEKYSTYVVRLFVHNNSPRAYECVAKDVMVKFDISETVYVDSRNVELSELNSKNGYYSAAIKGSITSSNASPKEYYDGVRFISKEPFHLKYVYGTAEYNNNHFKNGYILSDDIIKKYIRIGYDKMDGNIPGCFEYSGVATIKIMPVFDK